MGAESLLRNINILVQKNKEIWSLKGNNFNVFHLCKVDYYETLHSRILAAFLNPRESHGFGAKFLIKFCEMNAITALDYENVSVKTEVCDGNGDRFDIWIKSPACCIVIENKINANDQEKQIQRYLNYLNDQGQLLYLTLDGHECQDKQVKKDSYTCLSYKNNILPWLDECICIAAEKPFVRETLRQYRNLIQELTGNTMEKQIMNAIIKNILQSKENYEAAQQIANNWAGVKDYLKQKVENELYASISKKRLTLQDGYWSYFPVKNSNIGIFFEFWNDSLELYYGIGLNTNNKWKNVFQNYQPPQEKIVTWDVNQWWIMVHSDNISDYIFDPLKLKEYTEKLKLIFDDLVLYCQNPAFCKKINDLLSKD